MITTPRILNDLTSPEYHQPIPRQRTIYRAKPRKKIREDNVSNGIHAGKDWSNVSLGSIKWILENKTTSYPDYNPAFMELHKRDKRLFKKLVRDLEISLKEYPNDSLANARFKIWESIILQVLWFKTRFAPSDSLES